MHEAVWSQGRRTVKEEEENNIDEEEETEEGVEGSTGYHCSLLEEDALSMVDRKTGSIFSSLALENSSSSSSTASFGGSAQAEWEMCVD
ncbi:hypothetical protein E2320_018703 [Naja naja]|nr:hypothetical protein E2320_018703 [Naja naja]